MAWPGALPGATFGTVIPIGGHAADIALDEARGVLYVANFTANRIDVVSLADRVVRSSMNVSAQPGSLAISPNGQFLVITHFGSWTSTGTATNGITLINLGDNTRQTFTVGDTPLGVAFLYDGRALIVTSGGFLLFDPISGATELVSTFSNLAKTLPVTTGTLPTQINSAVMTSSGNWNTIYGLAEASSGSVLYRYDRSTGQVTAYALQASPQLSPKAVSVSRDGSYCMAGYALFDSQGRVRGQYPAPPPASVLAGSHAIDTSKGIIYAQIPEATLQVGSASTPTTTSAATSTSAPPTLLVLDADNLTVRERLAMPESLTGRMVLSSNGEVAYAMSDSGVMILPVGSLAQTHRLSAGQEDLVFRGNFCSRTVMSQDLTITDPGGGNTDFTITSDTAGVTVSPASGMTPATVRVRVDPNSFQSQNGTVTATLTLRSSTAVNIPSTVRVLINNRNPDQRGTVVNVAGKLVDVLADPARDRFYVLRQDKNQVQIYDGSSYQLIDTLRTATTPTQLAITFDRKYLMVGHDNSQFVYVWDLDSLEQQIPVEFPSGHYPRSIADSGKTMLALSRTSATSSGWISTAKADSAAKVDRFDLFARKGTALSTLGVFTNSVPATSVLAPSPNGASILLAAPDGQVMLYSSASDTFVLGRKDVSSLSGGYAVSSYEQYVVGNTVFNSALVPAATLDTTSGASSGFAFVDQAGVRSMAPSASAPGTIVRLDMAKYAGVKPTRTVEAPLLASTTQPFVRTLAPLSSRGGFISLSTSGFTVLPWSYDAAVAVPRIERVVNAADYTQSVAPGGLISIYGSQMSPVNLATKELPLPTALGESCLTVNGIAVPMIFVSADQINGQLPYNVEGNATMTLRTPGGISDNFYLTIQPTAPRIFRVGTASTQTGVATVVRSVNNEYVTPTNPIHPNDQIVIYATGLGRTSPAVEAGTPAPSDPLPAAIVPPKVALGDVSLEVEYAGLAPGQVGVYQINARVPSNVPQGMEVPLVIRQSDAGTSLYVRVVK